MKTDSTLITASCTWDSATQTFVNTTHQVNKFLKGPIPWGWIIEASKLSGKALLVGMAVWRLKGIKGEKPFYLTNSEVEALGVHRNTKSRALKELEGAGLIAVERKKGRFPKIKVLKAGRDRNT